MVRGSTGMGPAGAGGKSPKQGGDGQQRSVQNRLQFNPNIFGPPKQTPPKTSLAIPNLGLQFSNPTIGSPQGIANLGTVTTGAGFNFGGDGAGKQGGLNQDFTPQVGPPLTANIPAAPQGIDTLPVINAITSSLQTPTFTDFIKGLPLDPDNLFGGFPPGEDDTSSAFESGESVIDNINSLINTFENLNKIETPMGIMEVDIDPFNRSFKITKPFGAN